MSRIVAIEKKTVPAGKRNAGQVYFLCHAMVGKSVLNMRPATLGVFMSGKKAIDDVLIAEMEAHIANGTFPDVDLRRVIVGDPSVNPNDQPLPPFRHKDPVTGEVLPAVHTSMIVTVMFEDGKPVVSPRSQAMKIIETLMEPVQVSAHSLDVANDVSLP